MWVREDEAEQSGEVLWLLPRRQEGTWNGVLCIITVSQLHIRGEVYLACSEIRCLEKIAFTQALLKYGEVFFFHAVGHKGGEDGHTDMSCAGTEQRASGES